MKKIIFLIFLFTTQFLLANNTLDNFINEQIKIERQLLDQNLTLEEKVDIKKTQENTYKKFLLQYAADKKDHLQEDDPYRNEVSKLKLRLNSKKYQGKTNAVMRDEVLLQGYDLRKRIREALHEVVEQTESETKALFKAKLNDTLIKYFSKYTPLDKKKYTSQDQDQSSPTIQSLQEAIQDLIYLENVANTFSAELVLNSSHIYRAGHLSKSRFYTLLKKINTSYYGVKVNTYLTPYHLDISMIIFVMSVIVIILISQFLLRFIINYTLKYYKFDHEDIEYIHTHITKIFKIITTVFIIHVMLMAYLSFNIIGSSISKFLYIVYVILFTILLYRITNTIAYLKMESIISSKVLKNEVINLTLKIINSLIVLIAIIVILKIMGVDLTALLSGLGIAGAAVAFAAKDSIANLFGSVSILLGEVFEQGDWIETKDNISGTVVEIGLRATTIRTFDNALISIPNLELANNSIKNWSRRSIGRLIKMNIGVTYESNFDDIRQAIDEIRIMLKEHPGIANESTTYEYLQRQAQLFSVEDFKGVKRASLVYMDEFANSSINILVYCFSRSVVSGEWYEVKEDVMYKIADILKKNNLEFAYPALTLHHVEKENRSDN